VDRQPNDHLGRSRYGYGWEILRAVWSHTNTDAHSHSNGYGNTHSYANAYADTDGHGDRNTYGDSNAYTYTDADPLRGEMCTHTEAAPDSGTTPVAYSNLE
jgi:hypothetical protein